jgi:hypothetical protein
MPVNDVKIKVRNGYNEFCELEISPSQMGSTFGAEPMDVLMLTVTCRKDDANRSLDDTIHMAVNLNEFKNAIEICEQAWYDVEEKDECAGCGRP